MKRRMACLAVLVPTLLRVAFAADEAKKPVYLYLYARVTDHVNAGIAEDQLRRVLPMVEAYRKSHPDERVSATVLFSGAVSTALEARNNQTHIVDLVRDYIKRGVIEAGYDGSDEPTYSNRPTVDLTKSLTAEERWKELIEQEKSFLTTARDPITGATKAGSDGGLKKMQEVFGPASCITGLESTLRVGAGNYTTGDAPKPLPGKEGRVFMTPAPPPVVLPEVGGDTEAVLAASAYNKQAIMFGLPDANQAKLPGFGGGRSGFTQVIGSGEDSAPELFWQDHVLRSSETSSDVKLVRASDGLAAVQKTMNAVNRSRVRVVHVQIGLEDAYVKADFAKTGDFPPTRYAYAHPDKPELAAELLASKEEVDAAYAKQEDVLKWLSQEFLPANPGSSFVTGEALKHMVEPETGYTISVASLKTAANAFLKEWGNDTFGPSLFRVDGHYLSRAETFQVMTDAFAEMHKTGHLPESVTVAEVYGPMRVLRGHGPNVGQVSVSDLAAKCAELAPALHDVNGGVDTPKNLVPIGVTLNGVLLNPAQFLRMMASALQTPEMNAKVNIKMAYEFTLLGEYFPKSRPTSDAGFFWTVKPVVIRSGDLQTRASR